GAAIAAGGHAVARELTSDDSPPRHAAGRGGDRRPPRRGARRCAASRSRGARSRGEAGSVRLGQRDVSARAGARGASAAPRARRPVHSRRAALAPAPRLCGARRDAGSHPCRRPRPRLASALPVATPAPIRVGVPGCGYPWPWSIVTWIPGVSASERPLRREEAAGWGRFLRSLHGIDLPPLPPSNPYRGQPLAARDEGFRERIGRLGRDAALELDAQAALVSAWEAGLASPVETEPCWLHGDLHPRNVITDDGRLRGVIDWGDATAG